MSSHFTPPHDWPPNDHPTAGGAAVGLVTDLDPAAMLAVLYLRVWCDDGLDRVTEDFSLALGQPHGTRAAAAFGALCTACLQSGRRPLMRHMSGCRCLGGDEACFAQLLTQAATGDREDALMLAMLMVRADHAPGLVELAQQSGLALYRMTLCDGPRGQALH